MDDLFWPGDDRAGDHFSGSAFLAAMLGVEAAWLGVLIDSGVAPASARADLVIGGRRQLERLGRESELSGSPVPALLELVREHPQTSSTTASWLHRGLTSQDLLDSALMLMARDAVGEMASDLRRQAGLLAALAQVHRATPMVARTLTQHAVPTTFGLKVAHWLSGVLDAGDGLRELAFPVQLGGAAGTMAAAVELGLDPTRARGELAARLGLADAPAWHTRRTPVTRLADALVRGTDAWGRIAGDVLTLARPEIGELAEGAGGGSSTMPGKANPVLSVLVRRAALTTPQLAATLHLAASLQVDERADGAWHAEWPTLRDLVRRSVTAGSHVTELVGDLQVHPERMATTLATARDAVLAEQRSMAELAGHAPTGDYLGEADALIDAVLARAHAAIEEPR